MVIGLIICLCGFIAFGLLAYKNVKLKVMNTKQWFALMSVLAFGSAISFFQINSYWADQHNFNGFFGWLGIGIALGLGAAFCLYKVSKNSNTGGGSSVY